MTKRIVRFCKGSKRHEWFVKAMDNVKIDDTYRWNFTYEDGLQEALDIFKKEYELKATKVSSVNSVPAMGRFNIKITFRNNADEAAFILLANADRICLEDYSDETLFQ